MELSDLTDGEIAHLHSLLEDEGDKMHHHPGDFTAEDVEAHDSLMEKVRSEAKRRKFWWAR